MNKTSPSGRFESCCTCVSVGGFQLFHIPPAPNSLHCVHDLLPFDFITLVKSTHTHTHITDSLIHSVSESVTRDVQCKPNNEPILHATLNYLCLRTSLTRANRYIRDRIDSMSANKSYESPEMERDEIKAASTVEREMHLFPHRIIVDDHFAAHSLQLLTPSSLFLPLLLHKFRLSCPT